MMQTNLVSRVVIQRAQKAAQPMLLANKKKALGQVFTSPLVAEFMVSLARTDKKACVLEPSAGTGVFVKALKESNFSNVTALELDGSIVPPELVNKIEISNFLTYGFTSRFQLIIGNPPYVRPKHIPNEFKMIISSGYWRNKVNALSDLLQTFIFRSVDLLEPNGEMIFITPFFWLQSLHAQKLRDYLVENGHFEEIMHFGEHRLFKDASTNTIIFRFVKSLSTKKIKVIEMNGHGSTLKESIMTASKVLQSLQIQDAIESENADGFKINQFSLGEVWDIFNPKLDEKFNKMNKNSVDLGQICDIKVGMVSGLDAAFRVPPGLLNELSEKEKKKVIFVLKGKNMDSYLAKALTPYVKVDDVKTESELRNDYPNIYIHLLKFKSILLKRYDYDGTVDWWKWAFPRNEQTFYNNKDKPKIFVPSKDRRPHSRFCYTTDFCYGTQDSVVLTKKISPYKESLSYILCLLNSKTLNEWYRFHGIRRGDVRQYSLAPMSKIPIRKIDWNNRKDVLKYEELLSLSNRIIDSKEYRPLLQRINKLVDDLYFN